MKISVVERTVSLARVVHRSDVSQRHVSGDSREEHVKRLRSGACACEECTELELPDLHGDPSLRQVRLNELLNRIVAAADGPQLYREWPAPARARAGRGS